jgi:hypothetical protein
MSTLAAPALGARRTTTVWMLVGFIALLALHLVLAARMRGPMLFGDEVASPAIARFLAGKTPLPLMSFAEGEEFVPFYHFGNALFLAPAYALGLGPAAVYRWALTLNSIFLAALFPLLFAYGRRVLGLDRVGAAAAAGAVSLFPPYLLHSNLAWSESLLVASVALVLLAFHRLVAAPGPLAACGFAAASAFAYAVHQRALALLPCALVALAWLAVRRQLSWRAAALGAAVAAGGFVAVRALNAAIIAALWPRPSSLGVGELAHRLLEPESLAGAAASLTGQLWYLAVASLGLVPLGVVCLARTAARGETRAARGTALYTLVVAAALLGTSALFLVEFGRADMAFYGRYIEVVAAPFLAAGLAALARLRRRTLAFVAIVLLLPLLGLVLVALHDSAVFERVHNQFNVLGIEHFILVFEGIRVLRITAVATVLAGVLVLLGSRRILVASGWAGALFLAGALFTYVRFLAPINAAANEVTSLPRAFAALGPVREVSYDVSEFELRGFHGYQFWLDEVRFVPFRSDRRPPPREVVIAGKAFGERFPGAQVIFLERAEDQALWVMPGSFQRRLEAAGRLVAQDPMAPLDAAACRSRVEGLPDRVAVHLGERQFLPLRLRHAGTSGIWLPPGTRKDPWGSVRVGWRWRPAADAAAELVDGGRVDLPHQLLPGEEVELLLPLGLPLEDRGPTTPGVYHLELELVQEGVQWFRQCGDQATTLEMDLRP